MRMRMRVCVRVRVRGGRDAGEGCDGQRRRDVLDLDHHFLFHPHLHAHRHLLHTTGMLPSLSMLRSRPRSCLRLRLCPRLHLHIAVAHITLAIRPPTKLLIALHRLLIIIRPSRQRRPKVSYNTRLERLVVRRPPLRSLCHLFRVGIASTNGGAGGPSGGPGARRATGVVERAERNPGLLVLEDGPAPESLGAEVKHQSRRHQTGDPA